MRLTVFINIITLIIITAIIIISTAVTDRYFVVKTTDSGHRIAWLSNTDMAFTFSVKACHEARVALTYEPGNVTHHNYEIVLGGWSNMESAIFDMDSSANDPVTRVPTPQLLDCQDHRSFWIQWDRNGKVSDGVTLTP